MTPVDTCFNINKSKNYVKCKKQLFQKKKVPIFLEINTLPKIYYAKNVPIGTFLARHYYDINQ